MGTGRTLLGGFTALSLVAGVAWVAEPFRDHLASTWLDPKPSPSVTPTAPQPTPEITPGGFEAVVPSPSVVSDDEGSRPSTKKRPNPPPEVERVEASAEAGVRHISSPASGHIAEAFNRSSYDICGGAANVSVGIWDSHEVSRVRLRTASGTEFVVRLGEDGKTEIAENCFVSVHTFRRQPSLRVAIDWTTSK